MQPPFDSLGALQLAFLILALALAFGFECVNGFHDTANAVATVIYTRSLPPVVAVIWSGIWNFIGVITSNGAVAFAIVGLLPADLLMNVGSAAGFAMIFSLLVSAIIWNVGTWWLGLPASSTHTLTGAIIGVGVMNSLLHSGSFVEGVNWPAAETVGLSLLISPVIGFVGTALLFLAVKAIIRNPALYSAPDPHNPPPWWIRGILCLTCTGVSYAHGSNDGQKGMGLIVLILVGIVPGVYALKLDTTPADVHALVTQSQAASAILAKEGAHPDGDDSAATGIIDGYLKTDGTYNNSLLSSLAEKNAEIAAALDGHHSFTEIPQGNRAALRVTMYCVSATISKMAKSKLIADPADAKVLTDYQKALDATTKYIPRWVMVAVALSLGIGTMIGWKRIVVTVGEKIGKSHLTYAQGACAELVAMVTIGYAAGSGRPVSTTHVLSSGVAGAMAANHSGLQTKTLRNIVLAWVLTLPACMFLGGMLFAATLLGLAHLFGIH